VIPVFNSTINGEVNKRATITGDGRHNGRQRLPSSAGNHNGRPIVFSE
jgi:hypothetical protein